MEAKEKIKKKILKRMSNWQKDFFDSEISGSRTNEPPPATNIGGLPMQAAESIKIVNSLIDRCFTDCIYNFAQRKLTYTEKKCVNACVTKTMRANKRITRVFTEGMFLIAQEGNNSDNKSSPFDF